MPCWRLVNLLRGSGGGGRDSNNDGVPVTFSPDVSFRLSFFLFFLDASCVPSSCGAGVMAGVGDCWDLFFLTRLRFLAGRSPSADTPPLFPSFGSLRVFSAAGLAASCSTNRSKFTVADWTLSKVCLDVRLRFLGVTPTGSSGTDHPGTSKRAMVEVLLCKRDRVSKRVPHPSWASRAAADSRKLSCVHCAYSPVESTVMICAAHNT